MIQLIRFIFLFLGILVVNPADISAKIFLNPDDYSPHIGKSDSLLIVDANDQALVDIQADIPRTPASTLKLMTALMALHYLGLDYRFTTEAYQDNRRNIRIKGFGDPMLTSEVLMELARQISLRTRRFQDMILDAQYFDSAIIIPGIEQNTEPYNAEVGALCTNFNTIAFKTDRKGRYISDEPQTPLLPMAVEKIKPTRIQSGRITLSHDQTENTRYAGHLIGYFLNRQGVEFSNQIRIAKGVTPADRLIVRFESPHTLADIISRMLEFSSNFLANQLFLACGARAFGPPATLEKATAAARAFCQKSGLSNDIYMVEGSGISRENHLTAWNLSHILKLFEPHIQLMRHDGRERFKTGTLDGVRSRAGFIDGRDGNRYRFVVMINTPGKTVDAVMKKIHDDL
jgi:D-alanyl-D-alanine carboxypeptidase/D-alanyl-D-alanine-endopeptidase (penicillin-binding protein 4)